MKHHGNRLPGHIAIFAAGLLGSCLTLIATVDKPVAVAATASASVAPSGIYDVTIYAKNIAELGAFYDKLGLRRGIDSDKIIVYTLMSEQDLAIVASDQAPQHAMGMSFYVEDLTAMQTMLKAHGVSYEGPMAVDAGLRGIVVTDPNGNRINFIRSR